MIAEGDKVVVRSTTNCGAHKGEFLGIKPTGKHVINYTAINIYRIVSGKFVEEWSSGDILSFLQQQLGVTSEGFDSESASQHLSY